MSQKHRNATFAAVINDGRRAESELRVIADTNHVVKQAMMHVDRIQWSRVSSHPRYDRARAILALERDLRASNLLGESLDRLAKLQRKG